MTTGLSLLGCTDWRAGLGIHRTQAGRIGISPGRGWRAEARCSTTTPAIYSVTSATDPAAPRPGGATRVLGQGPARVRNHRHRPRPPERARARCPTVTVPGPPERARARCPAEDYSASSGEPASVTAPGRRSAPGPVPGRAAARPGARWPLTVPHVADRLAFTRAFGRAGSPDCSAARGPDATSTVATWWEQSRAGSAAKRSPQWAVLGAVPRTRRCQECGPAPGPPCRSSSLHGPRAAVAGPAGGPDRPESAGSQPILEPGPRAVSVGPQVGY